MRGRRPGARLVMVALAAVLALSGCAKGSSSAPQANPADALSQARQHLNDTSGVTLSLSTDGDPGGSAYLTSASGTITNNPPAFQGQVSGKYAGIPVSNIDVVAVGDTLEVDIPIKGYTTVDPSSLCAPNPATLLAGDSGVSAILDQATDVSAGDAVRGGQDNTETLTPYSATVPGAAMKALLPCSTGDSYAAMFDIDGDGDLRSTTITGDFGSGSQQTYTIDISAYDVSQTISLP